MQAEHELTLSQQRIPRSGFYHMKWKSAETTRYTAGEPFRKILVSTAISQPESRYKSRTILDRLLFSGLEPVFHFNACGRNTLGRLRRETDRR
jgi:hypothetical protein